MSGKHGQALPIPGRGGQGVAWFSGGEGESPENEIFRVIRLRHFSTGPLPPGTWGYVALSQLPRALLPEANLSEFQQRNATQREK